MQTLPFISLCQSKVKVLGRDPQIQARKQNRPNSRIYVRTEEGERGDSFGGGGGNGDGERRRVRGRAKETGGWLRRWMGGGGQPGVAYLAVSAICLSAAARQQSGDSGCRS